VITKPVDELRLVDRMGDAINGEVVRRQNSCGRRQNYASCVIIEKA